MKALRITKPHPNASAQVLSGSCSNIGALLTPDPREVATVAPGAAVELYFDLGGNQLVDTIFIGYNTFGAGAFVEYATVSTAAATTGSYVGYAGDNSLSVCPVGLGPRYRHGVIQFPLGAGVGRYIYVRINGGAAGGMIGALAAGYSFTARWGTEYGAGRMVADTSNVERLLSGSFNIDAGAIVGGYQWQFGDLQKTEREALYRIVAALGQSRSVLVIEDPDFAYDPLTAANVVTLSGSGKIITKNTNTGAYDGSAYSVPRSRGVGIAFTNALGNANGGVVGLSAAPTTSFSFTDIVYGVNFSNGGLQRWQAAAGNIGISESAWAAGDTLGITYDEAQFVMLKNGVPIDVFAASPDLSFGFDSALVANATQLSNVNVCGLNYDDRVHWGLFGKLDAFERIDPANTRWALTVADWA